MRDKIADLEAKLAAVTKERDEAIGLSEVSEEYRRFCTEIQMDCQAKDAALDVAEDDFKYIAEQCESVARVDGIEKAESRTWGIVGRLAREAAVKIKSLSSSDPAKEESNGH